ncbi:hypothetical protein EVAR_33456_1 [Eumeta japonica]|uniref:Uncharacterized protein n=1 Tax=Eumeta variegata TaxID=151549 RepID=A0A4C1WGS4_EUMVA|nr:hypothetical protein EVAR_33456_1 [Eumeta japonica]
MGTELSNEMSLLFDKLKAELDQQTIQITENITKTVLKVVDEKIQPIIAENERLTREVEKLNKQLQNLDVNARKNNIILHGIPEPNTEKYEDLNALVIKTITDLDVPLENSEINKVQRLGKKMDSEKIRPILLTTTTIQRKIQILKNKKKMQENTYITNDYSKDALEKRKIKTANYRESEKRKRISETPSPKETNDSASKKIQRTDAFQLMRERAYSMHEKNTYRNN